MDKLTIADLREMCSHYPDDYEVEFIAYNNEGT